RRREWRECSGFPSRITSCHWMLPRPGRLVNAASYRRAARESPDSPRPRDSGPRGSILLLIGDMKDDGGQKLSLLRCALLLGLILVLCVTPAISQKPQAADSPVDFEKLA